MMKRAVSAGIGFLALCFSMTAQQTVTFDQLNLYRPEVLSTMDCSTLLQRLPMLALLDGHYLPASSELGRMGTAPVDFFSDVSFTIAEVQRIIVRPDHSKDSGKDSPAEVMNPPASPIYYGGEVGFLYGHSSGKFGGDLFQSYLVGGVGNDKFQISVGASYEESNWRVPRRTR